MEEKYFIKRKRRGPEVARHRGYFACPLHLFTPSRPGPAEC